MLTEFMLNATGPATGHDTGHATTGHVVTENIKKHLVF